MNLGDESFPVLISAVPTGLGTQTADFPGLKSWAESEASLTGLQSEPDNFCQSLYYFLQSILILGNPFFARRRVDRLSRARGVIGFEGRSVMHSDRQMLSKEIVTRSLIHGLLVLALLAAPCGFTLARAAPEPAGLRCEERVNPLGIDSARPRLSWLLEAEGAATRGLSQKAYRILVASTPERLARDGGDLWDSGKVASDQSVLVQYAGKPLASGMACHWKVRTWDAQGQASAWSEPATWSLGLLTPEDWTGRWIGLDRNDSHAEWPVGYGGMRLSSQETSRSLPARYLRREVALSKPVRRATAYVCGLGLFELRINGRKVGDHVLEPGLTQYDRRALYVTFDVTKRLRAGKNAIAVTLGSGRYFAPRLTTPTATVTYGFPKLLLQIEVEQDDGGRVQIASDGDWKVTTQGPIRANNEYDGELYDARREMPGWDQPGFDDSRWEAVELTSPGAPLVTAQMNEPIRATQTLRPVAVKERKPGVFLFDMGQNMVGWCRLNVRGPAGARVVLRHAERLDRDGALYVDNLRSARAVAQYTLKGRGEESYEPRFTYYGFRYVEMSGYPGRPTLDSLTGIVVHDDLPAAGEFTCSDPTINAIAHNIVWGTRGNYRSIPTDCPQRDERQGWLGDRSAESHGESYLFDVAPFYRKWLTDIRDAQRESGSLPEVAPAYWVFYRDGVPWPATFILVPWMLYQQYGDRRALEENYPAMRKWILYMRRYLKDGLLPRDTYGDWCVPPESLTTTYAKDPLRQTPPVVLGTTYYYHCLKIMARTAGALCKDEDRAEFETLAAKVNKAFNERCYDAAQGCYGNGSQTSQILPLAFGMVPPERRTGVTAYLIRKIAVESNNHVGTGLIGGQWLMRTLTAAGRADLAFTLATQTTYPSWGYMIGQGATTMWELWNGDTADPGMNSGNHVMLVGDLGLWLFESLAGIQADPQRPGFKHILIVPQPVGGLSFVKASHRSPYGLIRSAWRRDGDRLTLEVTVPANSAATVHVPARSVGEVLLDGKPLDQTQGARLGGMENGAAVCEVGAGRYAFTSTMPGRP